MNSTDGRRGRTPSQGSLNLDQRAHWDNRSFGDLLHLQRCQRTCRSGPKTRLKHARNEQFPLGKWNFLREICSGKGVGVHTPDKGKKKNCRLFQCTEEKGSSWNSLSRSISGPSSYRYRWPPISRR